MYQSIMETHLLREPLIQSQVLQAILKTDLLPLSVAFVKDLHHHLLEATTGVCDTQQANKHNSTRTASHQPRPDRRRGFTDSSLLSSLLPSSSLSSPATHNAVCCEHWSQSLGQCTCDSSTGKLDLVVVQDLLHEGPHACRELWRKEQVLELYGGEAVQHLQITCIRHAHKHSTISRVITTFTLLTRFSRSIARPQSSSSTPGHSTLRTKLSMSACNKEGVETLHARMQICEHRTTTGSPSGVPGARTTPSSAGRCASVGVFGVHGAESTTITTEAELRGEQPGEFRGSDAVGVTGIGLLEPHVCTTRLCAPMTLAHTHACLATCALPLGSWPLPQQDTAGL